MKLSAPIIIFSGAMFVAVAADIMRRAAPKRRSGATLKRWLMSFFEWFGALGEFCVRFVKAAVTPPYEGKELLRQMDEIGAKSLPLVALAGAAIGGGLSMHTRDTLILFC